MAYLVTVLLLFTTLVVGLEKGANAQHTGIFDYAIGTSIDPVSYTHLRAHETLRYLVCRLLLEKKN